MFALGRFMAGFGSVIISRLASKFAFASILVIGCGARFMSITYASSGLKQAFPHSLIKGVFLCSSSTLLYVSFAPGADKIMDRGSGNARLYKPKPALHETCKTHFGPCICLTSSMCGWAALGAPVCGRQGCPGLHLNHSVMYNYIVVLEFPRLEFPESLKSFEVIASNRYAARKLAMHKYCKYATWWAAVLKTWGP